MKKLLTLACLAALLAPISAHANYAKDNCGGQEYLGNEGSKYPHLHCGKDFLTLSRSKNDHINLAPNSVKAAKACNKTAELLAAPIWNAQNTTNPGAITTALQSFQHDGCR